MSISITREEKLDFFLFLGQSMFYRQPGVRAEGSGFIVDTEGHIVTNAHVVYDMDKIQFVFTEMRIYIQPGLGSDPILILPF